MFGYAAFRGQQDAIIAAAVAGPRLARADADRRRKVAVLSDPGLLRDGVGIVVSPLIALMEDQVGALREPASRRRS